MFLKKNEASNLSTALNIAEKEVAKNQLITKLIGLEKARYFSSKTAHSLNEQIKLDKIINCQMRKYIEEYCKKYEPWVEEN